MKNTSMKNEKVILFIFLIIIFLVPTTPLKANTNLAKSLENKYKNLASWQADFDQVTYVEILKDKIKKKGQISVKRPDKIRIEYKTKPSKIYASNGKKLWIYKEDELTAKQFNKPKKIISKEALSFLSGLKDLTELFDVTLKSKGSKNKLKIKNNRLTKMILTPKNSGSPILKITLGIDKAKLTLNEAVIVNASNNITHFIFKKIAFNKALNDTLFILPKKPKRKIIKQ